MTHQKIIDRIVADIKSLPSYMETGELLPGYHDILAAFERRSSVFMQSYGADFFLDRICDAQLPEPEQEHCVDADRKHVELWKILTPEQERRLAAYLAADLSDWDYPPPYEERESAMMRTLEHNFPMEYVHVFSKTMCHSRTEDGKVITSTWHDCVTSTLLCALSVLMTQALADDELVEYARDDMVLYLQDVNNKLSELDRVEDS